MTQCLQDFIYASEDFKGKSEKLAQSIEINSFLLADSSIGKEHGLARWAEAAMIKNPYGKQERKAGVKMDENGVMMAIFLRLCYTINSIRKGAVLYVGKQG